MKCRAPVALGLARADDHQHLGPVQGQQAHGRTGARSERLKGLDVLADSLCQFTTGHRGIAQEQHGPVLIALECAHGEVPGMQGVAEEVDVAHGHHGLIANLLSWPTLKR